ncbi:urease accessory protein UreE [Halalkalibacter krulwichiae]|uniref:Urease accessory protein UreE n=1 Tax=Halalkalibacter krulwichiae TaxID=199441 RepID=A0A1X9MH40_9BACI|nr:urease accessory protein UreE [Halalkalibacter krulwichiae]ARK32777.1 Urease accessory protein UreE [Halalkalibacter krulwichiae]
MIVQSIIGNINKQEVDFDKLEWIELDWEELNKRIIRKHTDKGREIAITLDHNTHLHVGDIVFQDDNSIIAIRTKLEPAYVIKPTTFTEIGKVSWELGNRHTPCIVTDSEIVVRYDETLETIFKKVNVAYEKTERRFETPFKYKGHHHH